MRRMKIQKSHEKSQKALELKEKTQNDRIRCAQRVEVSSIEQRLSPLMAKDAEERMEASLARYAGLALDQRMAEEADKVRWAEIARQTEMAKEAKNGEAAPPYTPEDSKARSG